MIEPPDAMLTTESLISPIVINDKMLTSVAGIASSNYGNRSDFSSVVSPNLLTQYDMEIFKQIQNCVNDKNYLGSFDNDSIDSEIISNILMDINYQDYELQTEEMI